MVSKLHKGSHLSILCLTLIVFLSDCSRPPSESSAGHANNATAKSASTPVTPGSGTYRDIKGTIETIDLPAAQIEINHEEIKGYMPPMLMYYHAKDPSLLKGLSVKDHVTFTIEDHAGTVTLTAITRDAR
jgi:Cu/Ag efflux protein CusF